MWYCLCNWFVKITGWLPQLIVFKTKIIYEDKNKQSRAIRGKAVIASNHRSVFDMALLMFLFPYRTLRCIVAEVMFQKNPLFSFFLKCLGAIKVERNAYDFSFVEKSCKILDKGGVVEIYPESRLPKKDEETPLPFKPSAVYIALISDSPIIPVYTNGKYFTKERVKAVIGTPINVRELYRSELSEQDNIANITEQLRNKIISLKNEFDEETE